MTDYAEKIGRRDNDARQERERLMSGPDPQGPINEVPPEQVESMAASDTIEVTTSTAGETSVFDWTRPWGESTW